MYPLDDSKTTSLALHFSRNALVRCFKRLLGFFSEFKKWNDLFDRERSKEEKHQYTCDKSTQKFHTQTASKFYFLWVLTYKYYHIIQNSTYPFVNPSLNNILIATYPEIRKTANL